MDTVSRRLLLNTQEALAMVDVTRMTPRDQQWLRSAQAMITAVLKRAEQPETRLASPARQVGA